MKVYILRYDEEIITVFSSEEKLKNYCKSHGYKLLGDILCHGFCMDIKEVDDTSEQDRAYEIQVKKDNIIKEKFLSYIKKFENSETFKILQDFFEKEETDFAALKDKLGENEFTTVYLNGCEDNVDFPCEGAFVTINGTNFFYRAGVDFEASYENDLEFFLDHKLYEWYGYEIDTYYVNKYGDKYKVEEAPTEEDGVDASVFSGELVDCLMYVKEK